MSMSISFHTRNEGKLEVEAKIVTNEIGVYPVLNFTQIIPTSTNNDLSMFPSFDQVKEIYVELGKLVEEMEEREDILAFSKDCEEKEEF